MTTTMTMLSFSRLSLPLLLIVLAFSSSLATTARAEETPVRGAVLPLTRQGATQAQEESIRRAMGETLGRHGTRVVDSTEVERRLMATDLSCTTARCLAARAKSLQVDLLLGGRVSREERGKHVGWTLDGWVFDARRGETLATVHDRCDACDPRQARAWAAKVAARLLEEARVGESRVQLVVSSNPAGATISVDGTSIGATPMTFWLSPGRHTVVLSKAGHRLSVHEVMARSGEPLRLEARMEPHGPAGVDTGPTDAPGTSAGTTRVLKWVTLGTAVAALAAGITLLALDGQGTCDTARPEHECMDVYNTLAPGVVLTVVGGLSAVGSGILFYMDHRSRDQGDQVGKSAGLDARIRF